MNCSPLSKYVRHVSVSQTAEKWRPRFRYSIPKPSKYVEKGFVISPSLDLQKRALHIWKTIFISGNFGFLHFLVRGRFLDAIVYYGMDLVKLVLIK